MQEGKKSKSKEQLEAEKKAILKQRIVKLEIDGLSQSALAEKAKELHKSISRLEGEKYDLEKRFKTQQVDVSTGLYMKFSGRVRKQAACRYQGLKLWTNFFLTCSGSYTK